MVTKYGFKDTDWFNARNDTYKSNFCIGLDYFINYVILNITIRKYSTKIRRYKACCGCSEINVLQHFFFLYLVTLLRTTWDYFFLVNYFLECLQQHISVSISKPRWYSFEIMHRKTIPNQIKHTFYARYRFTLFLST